MLLVGALGMMTPAAALAAGTLDIVPYVAEFQNCDSSGDGCGPRGENDGPGGEQTRGTTFTVDGKTYIAWVTMSSYQIPNRDQGPYQCRLSVASLDAINGLVIEVDNTLITNNQGNRPCNHPDLIYAGGTDMLFCYGTNDANNANVQWYGQVYGLDGVAKGARTRLSDGNGNDGAGECQMVLGADMALANTGARSFLSCYNDNGDNADCTRARVNDDGTVTKVADIANVIDPANIPRPFITQYSPTFALACAAKGDERPPEDGNYCRAIDLTTNTRVGNQLAIMRSNENVSPRIYANSIEVQNPLAYGDFIYTLNLTSSGTGRNNDDNGAVNVYLDALSVKADNTVEVVARTPIGQNYQGTHSAMCTGSFGPTGAHSALLIQGSISGSGPGVATPYTYDAATESFTAGPLKVTTSTYSDVAELANEYGNNPNTQGRDFISCIGDIPNPGFGVEGGFMPQVRTFFAIFNNGKYEESDYKNSSYITLFPGHTPDGALEPDEPPDDPGSPTGPTDPNDPNGTGSGASGGCTTVATTGQGMGSAILLLGAMFLVIRRRRRQ
jgi:hypothetical protein